MLIKHQHPNNKSIMLSVLGAPNVGKSSLINYLLGTELSIVANRPQTTRNRFHCVFTIDRTEVVLVDTPGFHRSNQEINKRMNQQAAEGSFGADINLLLIDLSREIKSQFVDFNYHFEKELGKCWVVFTKSDLVKDAESLPLEGVIEQVKELIPSIEKYFVISTETGDNIHNLIGAICDNAPEGPHLYTNGRISNKNSRFFAAEYIREQAFLLLKEEIPYEVAVTIENFKETNKHESDNEEDIHTNICASILVNRPSQRAIVVGSKGGMIKEIGTRARQKIENILGGNVHLNLHVKVAPRWFKNNFVLEELGLPRADNSARIWRKK